MIIQIVDGKWDFNSLGNLPTAIDLFINCHRVAKPQRPRGHISKEHNYKFKTVKPWGEIKQGRPSPKS